MCVAELNLSTLPCRHRWYHLVRPCVNGLNLYTCPGKLGLEGWEIKCDFCPFCAEWNIDDGSYRLVGNDRSPSIGGLSRASSTALSSHRRESRRGSIARTDSSTSITILAASEKNRAINARLDAYLSTARPERVVSLDSRHSVHSVQSADRDDTPPSPTTDSSLSVVDEKTSIFGKRWRKGKRLSLSFFK